MAHYAQRTLPILGMRRNFLDNPETLSDGVATGLFYRTAHTALRACSGIRVAFSNLYWVSPLETSGLNPIMVKAALERNGAVGATGQTYPLFFGGIRTKAIDGGGWLVSDLNPMNLAAGETFHVRGWVTVTNVGEKWPLGCPPLTGNTGPGEWTHTADIVDSGVGSYSLASASFGPTLILADGIPSTVPVVGILGDSIAHGFGDTIRGRGWAGLGFEPLSIPYVNVGTDGENAQQFVLARRWGRMRPLEGYINRVVCAFGRNDLSGGRTLAQIQGDLQTIWGLFTARGIPVYQHTIPPRTTSTDSWATTANQTPHSSEPVRVALNDWIRTTPSPLRGFLEFADPVETARNSGIWKVGSVLTTDGIHPSPAGYAQMAAVVPAAW